MSRLPRTTEHPVPKRGDGCSGLPARAVPQSHGRKPVVRGLPISIGVLFTPIRNSFPCEVRLKP